MERFQYVLVIDENTTIEDLQATLMQAFLLRLIAVAYEVIFTFNSSVKQINFAFSDVQIRFSSLFLGPNHLIQDKTLALPLLSVSFAFPFHSSVPNLSQLVLLLCLLALGSY